MQGILFKPWKQKAIRESPLDRLWQTRRLDHLKEINKEPDKWHLAEFYQATGGNGKWWAWFSKDGQEGKPYTIMPRYQPNETVYIKEAYWEDSGDIYFKSDMQEGQIPTNMHFTEPVGKAKWRSPMFLPEWAARDYIKITDVRPERLQEITEEDIIAEGIERGLTKIGSYYAFGQLWNSINKTYPYDLNPWCWRIYFNLIENKR